RSCVGEGRTEVTGDVQATDAKRRATIASLVITGSPSSTSREMRGRWHSRLEMVVYLHHHSASKLTRQAAEEGPDNLVCIGLCGDRVRHEPGVPAVDHFIEPDHRSRIASIPH